MNTLVNEKIVNSLLNDNSFNTQLKAMLNQMIDEELVKDIDEMDCDLIEECTNMLIELEQQDDDGFAVIIPLISSEKIMAACTKNKFRYLSKGLRASIIAAIILFSAFTTNTVIAKMFDYNIAQEVISTITEKLEDWGVIADAESRNEINVNKIPYNKPDIFQESETAEQPETLIESKQIVNKAPPKNNTEQYEEKKPEAEQPTDTVKEPDTDNTLNPPVDKISNTYTLTFEIKDDDSYTFSKTVTYGKPIGEIPVVSHEGYTFKGWYNIDISYSRDKNGKRVETPLKSTTIYNLEQDAVVVAKWSRIVTVNLNAEGGGCDTERILLTDESQTTDLPIPVREGYVFFGWYSEKRNEIYYTSDDLYMDGLSDGFINLSALWQKEGEMRTVTFYVEFPYGKCDIEEKEYMLGHPYGELPTPTPNPDIPDLKFLSWAVPVIDTLSFEYIFVDENTIFDRFDELVALWYSKSAVVFFDANGGECDIKTKTVYSYNYYTKLPTPTKEGYTFAGWYREDTGKIVTDGTFLEEEFTVDHTLVAQWEPIKVPITFSANGGMMNKGADAGLMQNYGYMQQFGELPEASRKSHRFTGWYTEPVGGDKIEEDDLVDFIEPAVYYAHWEKDDNVCVVIFYSNDGKSNNTAMTLQKGDELALLKQPVMSSVEKFMYKFTGWYNDKYYGEKIEENITITDNTELYAHWMFNNKFIEINYKLELEKTQYRLNEQIDPETVSLIVEIPMSNFSEAFTPEMLMAANAVYDCDTSTPGTHILTVTAAFEGGYVVTFRASAEITVIDEPYTEPASDTDMAYTKKESNPTI